MDLKKLNPAVDKKYHILISGLMWCGVGMMLISFAAGWLIEYHGRGRLLFAAAGILIALPIHFYGFSGIAKKNIDRIMLYSTPRCIFSFMTLKSWLTVIVMMALGIGLRHSSVPRQALSILYTAIGAGLFLSGSIYLRRAFALFL